MDDKRVREWAEALDNELTYTFGIDSVEGIEQAAKKLLSEAIAEYKEDAERYRHLMREGQHLGVTITETHTHRCMRCKHEFFCFAPKLCKAFRDVLPRVVVQGPSGEIEMFEHVCGNAARKSESERG
jgi:hypothetical protein